jgi:hypothetical protein
MDYSYRFLAAADAYVTGFDLWRFSCFGPDFAAIVLSVSGFT